MKDTVQIVTLLQLAVERGASDLLITVGAPPMLRIDGQYVPTDYPRLTPLDSRRLMYDIMDDKQQRRFEEAKELDFSFALAKQGRFRVNAFYQRNSVAGALRIVPQEILSFEELGLPNQVGEIAMSTRGLVLVTGPTGSGKSTTLAAMVDYINERRRAHIVTIEDPIEYLHRHKRSIVNQREVGGDTHSFAAALRSVLREAPDVILVGELRDYETMSAAITAAETGHLVLATLHTSSAPETVDRIVDVFPEAQQNQVRVQLSNNLVAVLTQQLLPRAFGEGRILAYEFMLVTPPVRALIREGKSHQLTSVIQTGAQHGMITMDSYLASLYRKRLITYDMGLARCIDQKEFARIAGDASASQGSPGQATQKRSPI